MSQSAAGKNEKFAEVVFSLALRHPLTYRIPEDLEEKTKPGCRVQVPIGKRSVIGCILKISTSDGPHKIKGIKDIQAVLDEEPILLHSQIKLWEWASAYYLTPLNEVLRHLLPPSLLKKQKRESRARKSLPPFEPFLKPPATHLTPAQKKIVEEILPSLEAPTEPFLLHGRTGSGKTEIYLKIVQEILKLGAQALVLVPEIGLTPQLIGRFLTIDQNTAVYHSALTDAQRYQIWKNVREGKISVVIATRSGIFLPFPNLKTIIIDEEHDSSYKQEERFCYHARDLALWRGGKEKALILLGSATPSLESFHRVEKGKIRLLELKERPEGVTLPVIHLVDRRNEAKNSSLFSADLLQAVGETLKKKEQSLLFLNRRGYVPFILCPQCGHVPLCDQCDIALTLHREFGPQRTAQLLCHYCDKSQAYQAICSHCHQGTMTLRGFGTERIASDLKALFPYANVERFDRDTAEGDGWINILQRMKKREIDILVGTQMTAKGHDYPHLTLVGILDADLSLNLPDFRASERTFQMITQVSGRAGRDQKPGRVFIQTYHPNHPSLEAAQNPENDIFYAQEMKHRREAGYPPFFRLIEIRITGLKPRAVVDSIKLLAQKIQKLIASSQTPNLATILGPSACPLEKIRGKTRWHLLIKTLHYTKLQPGLQRLLDEFAQNQLPFAIRMLANVDPVDMM